MRLWFQSRIVPEFCAALALSCGIFPAAVFGQAAVPGAVTIVEPPAPLLPRQFGAWQQLPSDPSSPVAIANDADRSILSEDGLSRSAAFTYKREPGSESIEVKAYQFGDATGAFSAFTYLRAEGYRAISGVKLGTSAAQKGDDVLIWNGPSVVLAEFHGGHRVAELADLVAVLPKVGGPKGLAPLLPTMLPEKGLDVDSLKYALGSSGYEAMGGVLPSGIIGFDKSAEVATAKYGRRGTLTLLLYPTPTIAGEHGRQIEAEMNRQGAAAGTVKLRRQGPLVILTTGAWPVNEAKELVESIHLNTELTYDKPMPLEFHAEVRKTASLMVTILELSGALMLAAVVLGLFFGGGRAAIRVLQGKPAATEPEFLRIDLRDAPGEGGRFKPLH